MKNKEIDSILELLQPIKIHWYQKLWIRIIGGSKGCCFMSSAYRRHPTDLSIIKIQMAKAMKLDFIVVSPSGIKEYKKGRLVNKSKHKDKIRGLRSNMYMLDDGKGEFK